MDNTPNLEGFFTAIVVKLNALEQQVADMQAVLERIAPAYYSEYKAKHRSPEYRPDTLADTLPHPFTD